MSEVRSAHAPRAVWLLQRNDVVGGTKTIVDGLEARLRAAGIAASAVYLRNLKELETAKAARWAKPLSDVRDFVRLLQRLRRERPDVVVTFTPLLGAVVGMLAPVWSGSKVISTLHTSSDLVGRTALRLDALAARLGRYRGIIACSASVADSYKVNGRSYMEQVSVVSNGVQPSHEPRGQAANTVRSELGAAGGAKLAVAVGRLTASKNLEILVRALTELPNWWLVLLGGGEAQRDLERLAHELGVAERVRFMGRVGREAVDEWLLNCDAYVQPSWAEGLSLALLEAMARGIPVVASDIPANWDPLRSEGGDVGLLVSPASYVAWVSALKTIEAGPEAASEVGERARERQRSEFDEETMYRRYIEFVVRELGA